MRLYIGMELWISHRNLLDDAAFCISSEHLESHSFCIVSSYVRFLCKIHIRPSLLHTLSVNIVTSTDLLFSECWMEIAHVSKFLFKDIACYRDMLSEGSIAPLGNLACGLPISDLFRIERMGSSYPTESAGTQPSTGIALMFGLPET